MATRGLLDAVKRIEAPLLAGNLAVARQKLAHIVGRETAELNQAKVLCASLESLAESTCDGIVAPLFYLFLGGVPAAMAYKAISTLDSMIGYRTDRYFYFGKFAARLDDAANYIPARLTAGFIVVASLSVRLRPARALRIAWRDHGNHLSPNAGYPEAALAGAFGVRLGGPSIYFGRRLDKPYLGDDLTPITIDMLKEGRVLCLVTAILSLATFALLSTTRAYVDRTHGGDVEHWAQSVGIEAGEILDFSASINPLRPPATARKAFIESYDAISRYPDAYGNKLKKTLATRHGMKPAEVLIGNGSTQLIYLICAVLRPRKALVLGPAFSEYSHALTPRRSPHPHSFFFQPIAALGFQWKTSWQRWETDCDVAFLATPNSVTGQLIPKAEIETIAHFALTRKTLVVADEAFIDFVEDQSVKRKVRHNPNFLVLRSLTKFYGIPGLRLGYLLGDARRVEQLAVHQEPWSVNGPALNVALACLNDMRFITKTNRWLEGERQFLSEQLTATEGIASPAVENQFFARQDR